MPASDKLGKKNHADSLRVLHATKKGDQQNVIVGLKRQSRASYEMLHKRGNGAAEIRPSEETTKTQTQLALPDLVQRARTHNTIGHSSAAGGTGRKEACKTGNAEISQEEGREKGQG